MTMLEDATWVAVCRVADLQPGRGACVLVDGRQVALFRVEGDEVVGLANHDPASGANVLSRGLLGSRGDRRYVASPMYKHRFDLDTGVCLDDESLAVGTYAVRVADGLVEVGR